MKPAASEPVIAVQRAVASPRGLPSAQSLRGFARAALPGGAPELTIRIVDEAESRALNHRYRGKDKPTNVLSFQGDGCDDAWPTAAQVAARATRGGRSLAAKSVLGDLVICAPVVAREAEEQGKTLREHWAHMVVHGCLHLQGYDHEQEADARRMEAREIRILKELGFDNPYT